MAKASNTDAPVASIRHEDDIDSKGTIRTTQTIVEDRTESAEARPAVEYEVVDHGVVDQHGTTLTTVMEPVGGFPSEAAPEVE